MVLGPVDLLHDLLLVLPGVLGNIARVPLLHNLFVKLLQILIPVLGDRLRNDLFNVVEEVDVGFPLLLVHVLELQDLLPGNGVLLSQLLNQLALLSHLMQILLELGLEGVELPLQIF